MTESPPEQPFFYGKSRHALDHKNRITIPAKWRREDGADVFFVLPHHKAECLLVMPPDQFRAVGERVRASALPAREKRAFQREFFSQAERCSADKQGRLLLPEGHCAKVGLAGEVMMIGAEQQIEIWNPEAWDRSRTAEMATYERVAEDYV
jgi:MraZ protein